MTINPDDYAAIGGASAPAFTCDGHTLLFLRGIALPQICALALDTRTERQCTRHDEAVALLRRCPVDDRIIYGIDRGGDERQQFWMLDAAEATPMPRPLTDNPAAIHAWGAWAPDGKSFAYAANDRDEAVFDVYLQEVAGGARRCVWRGDGIVGVSGFRPDGGVLTLLHDRGYGDMSLLLLDLASGETWPFPQLRGCNYQSVRWARDGSSLLALTDHGDSDFLRLCRLDPHSGSVTLVYAAPGRDVEAWALSPDGNTLATVENDRGYALLRIGLLGAAGGSDPSPGEPRSVEVVRQAVAGLPRGVVGEPTFSPDGGRLAFTVAAPTQPASLWLWRDGAAQQVWRPEPLVDPESFADCGLVEWRSFDGVPIQGWLALPSGTPPSGGHPAVVWVHGGPVAQARPHFRPDMQLLLACGFAVLMPNVRGSSGYGRAFAERDDGAKRLDSVADLAAGREFLATHPAIDSQRIGIMGQSYGGFMVLSAITEYPHLWRAAVDYYGIADFATTLAGTGAWRRSHRAAEYGEPQPDVALFERISPIHRIERVQVPLLVAHGMRDPRVPIGESEQVVAAMRERQQPVTYLTFDYAGHGFIRPADRRRIFTAVAEFFRAHL